MTTTAQAVRVFIDVDVNGWRAAYQRAVDFVEQNNLKYSLSSDDLEALGGSEKKRVRTEYYPNDFAWAGKGEIRLKRREERIILEVRTGARTPASISSALGDQPLAAGGAERRVVMGHRSGRRWPRWPARTSWRSSPAARARAAAAARPCTTRTAHSIASFLASWLRYLRSRRGCG
jgi:hypothetical protein